MARVGLEVKRAEQWVFLVLDRSGSMSGSRLEAMKDGAKEIVNTLRNGDMLCLFTFNQEVVRHIQPTEINDLSKMAILLAIHTITAEGRTSLYDAILATTQEIAKHSLSTKLLQKVLDDEEKRRFVLVVLTDGADVCSKHNLQQTQEILSGLNSTLGKEFLLIHFIGVKLDSDGERAMKSLSDAAGDSATYERVESTEAIKAKFHEISLGLSLQVDQAPEIDFNGFLGRHVRILRASRGMGSMHVGAVGVVKGQDADGDYRVNFREQDNWCAGPGDIEVDHVADQIRPGVRAEVKSSISLDSLKFKKGPLEKNMVGLVTSVSHDGVVKVDYGFNPKNEMSLLLSELQPVYTDKGHWKNASIQCGQPVRVKDGISEPSTNWGNIRKGDVGFAQYLQPNGMVRCNFPRKDGWVCKQEELEIDRTAALVKSGEKVRVKRSVVEPACGWGNISHQSVGIVTSVSYDAKVQVAFSSCSKMWHGHLCELEPIPSGDLSMVDLKQRAARQGISDSAIASCYERRDLEALMGGSDVGKAKGNRPPASNPSLKQSQEPCMEIPTAVPCYTKDTQPLPASSSQGEGDVAAALALALAAALAADDEQEMGFHTGKRVLKGKCVGSCCSCQTRCSGQCGGQTTCHGDCQWTCCGKKGRKTSWPGCKQTPRAPGCRCCVC